MTFVLKPNKWLGEENEACEVLIKIIEDIQENLSLNIEGQYQKLRNRKPELFI